MRMKMLLLLLLLAASAASQYSDNRKGNRYNSNNYNEDPMKSDAGRQRGDVRRPPDSYNSPAKYGGRQGQGSPLQREINGRQTGETRVLLTIQLMEYRNPKRKLPNQRSCHYADTHNDEVLEANCRMKFATIIGCPSGTTKFVETKLLSLQPNGMINLQQMSANWTSPQTFHLAAKPTSMDILVYHLGNVVSDKGKYISYHQLVFVEGFSLDLFKAKTSPQRHVERLTGTPDMGTRNCTNSLQVHCKRYNSVLFNQPNQNNAIGRATDETKAYSYAICEKQQDGSVDKCVECPHGYSSKAGGQCNRGDEVADQGLLVSSAWMLWTWILLGLLIFLIIVFLVSSVCFVFLIRRGARREEAETNYHRPVEPLQPPMKSAIRNPNGYSQVRREDDWYPSGGEALQPPRALQQPPQARNDSSTSHSSFSMPPSKGGAPTSAEPPLNQGGSTLNSRREVVV